jgi:hypothetical protein
MPMWGKFANPNFFRMQCPTHSIFGSKKVQRLKYN